MLKNTGFSYLKSPWKTFLLKSKKNENHKKKTYRNIRRLHLRFQKVIIITLIAFVYKNIRN